jgi:hypothetical protein
MSTERGLWRSWERASMAWKRSRVRISPGPPNPLQHLRASARLTPRPWSPNPRQARLLLGRSLPATSSFTRTGATCASRTRRGLLFKLVRWAACLVSLPSSICQCDHVPDCRALTVNLLKHGADVSAISRLPCSRCRASAVYSLNQAALDFSSSRMMRRSVSSNLGDLPSKYSRSAALINV